MAVSVAASQYSMRPSWSEIASRGMRTGRHPGNSNASGSLCRAGRGIAATRYSAMGTTLARGGFDVAEKRAGRRWAYSHVQTPVAGRGGSVCRMRIVGRRAGPEPSVQPGLGFASGGGAIGMRTVRPHRGKPVGDGGIQVCDLLQRRLLLGGRWGRCRPRERSGSGTEFTSPRSASRQRYSAWVSAAFDSVNAHGTRWRSAPIHDGVQVSFQVHDCGSRASMERRLEGAQTGGVSGAPPRPVVADRAGRRRESARGKSGVRDRWRYGRRSCGSMP